VVEQTNQPEPQQLAVVTSIIPMQDGAGAFVIFQCGPFMSQIALSSAQVDAFFQQWIGLKKQIRDVLRVVGNGKHLHV